MNLVDYQAAALTTAIYPKEAKVVYPTLGLGGEIGEYWEKASIYGEDGAGELLEWPEAVKELGDVMWYVAALASDLGLSLGQIKRNTSPFEMTGKTYPIEMMIYYGKISEVVKKVIRDGGQFHDKKPEIGVLLGRLMWCIQKEAGGAKSPFTKVLEMNIEKLFSRKKRGKLGGSGDNR